MEKIKHLIKKLKIEDLVDDQLLKEFKIKKFKKNSLVIASGDCSGKAMYIFKGEVKTQVYTDEGEVFYGRIKEGDSFGFLSTVLDSPVVPDYVATKESEILSFPLKKIMTTRKDIMDRIWAKISIKVAEESISIISHITHRVTSSNELILLKNLEDNNGIIKYSTAMELSENLNVHLRTLQRIIKKLSEKNIIEKSIGTIKIKNLELFKKEKQRFIK